MVAVPTAVLATIIPLAIARSAGPQLPATAERLSAAEANAVRQAVFDGGPATGNARRELPSPRVLLMPDGVRAVYDAKPRATVRLLLQIVEGGRPWDSFHATCCIQALVDSPEYAAVTARVMSGDKWDEPRAPGQATDRERSLRVCIRKIIEKEQPAPKPGKKAPR